MSIADLLSGSAFPRDLTEGLRFVEVEFVKAGMVNVRPTDEFRERISSGLDASVRYTYLRELLRPFNDSDNFTAIMPRVDLSLGDSELDGVFETINFWGWDAQVCTQDYLRLEVTLSDDLRRSLYPSLPGSWNPGTFTLRFNGALFWASTRVDSAPVSSDLGQIARELLVATLAGGHVLKVAPGPGPSPMRADIYIARVRPKTLEHELLLPQIRVVDDEVLILIPESASIASYLDFLVADSNLALQSFYDSRLIAAEAFRLQCELTEHNKELTGSLVEFLGMGEVKRVFSGAAAQIRRIVAEFYLELQRISDLEMDAGLHSEGAHSRARGCALHACFVPQFKNELRLVSVFDRDAQLRLMEFAANEATNSAVIRASIVSACLGALAGLLVGMLTLVT